MPKKRSKFKAAKFCMLKNSSNLKLSFHEKFSNFSRMRPKQVLRPKYKTVISSQGNIFHKKMSLFHNNNNKTTTFYVELVMQYPSVKSTTTNTHTPTLTLVDVMFCVTENSFFLLFVRLTARLRENHFFFFFLSAWNLERVRKKVREAEK